MSVSNKYIGELKCATGENDVAKVMTSILTEVKNSDDLILTLLHLVAEKSLEDSMRTLAVSTLMPFAENNLTGIRKALANTDQRVAQSAGLIINKIVESRGVKLKGLGGMGQYLYELYEGDNKKAATAFLNGIDVWQKNYYIEIETNDGTFCKDIEGTYQK